MPAKITPEDVFDSMQLPAGGRLLLAGYSGGLDSHVLVHLLSRARQRLPLKLAAVHVNHGLNPAAGLWAEHCRSICNALDIEFILVELDARAPRGESQEAWARQKRYAAMQEYIKQDDVLMTAHHQDDTAETLLIQLFRGAGPAGLAAMPRAARFGRGWHLRPLLDYTRAELQDYANTHGLAWIEDDSNTDQRYDRNYLRNSILPPLRQRWPGLTETLSRAASHQASAALLLDEFAAMDMTACARDGTSWLAVNALTALSLPRLANVLRYWIKSRGFPLPADRQLAEAMDQLFNARTDAEPCVSWKGVELRRYRNTLFITAPLPRVRETAPIEWDMAGPCQLPLGVLVASRSTGKGIQPGLCDGDKVTVRFRRGSELIHKDSHRQELRKLFQEHGVPASCRDFMPLVYAGDRLVAVPGLYVHPACRAAAGAESLDFSWCLGPDYVFPIGIS